ncbi:hypothetical protein CHISP_1503 [Chitinispirillum alkaliphilum]|nr:hypothetical protein CHISP_1503 [Chitinispirillum alkaliphilum]
MSRVPTRRSAEYELWVKTSNINIEIDQIMIFFVIKIVRLSTYKKVNKITI